MGRKKLNDRTSLYARVGTQTADAIKEIAKQLGYIHANEGSTGQLLDAIASGELSLAPAKKSSE